MANNYQFFGVARGAGAANPNIVATGTIADGGTLASTADIYVLVNQGTSSNRLDVRKALDAIQNFLLSNGMGTSVFPSA